MLSRRLGPRRKLGGCRTRACADGGRTRADLSDPLAREIHAPRRGRVAPVEERDARRAVGHRDLARREREVREARRDAARREELVGQRHGP